MKTYILLLCVVVLTAINLLSVCVNYLIKEPVQVCPNRLVERPVPHPADLPKPTLVVPGKS